MILRRLFKWVFGPNPDRWGHDFRMSDDGDYVCSACGTTLLCVNGFLFRDRDMRPEDLWNEAWWTIVTADGDPENVPEGVFSFKNFTDFQMRATLLEHVGPCEDLVITAVMGS